MWPRQILVACLSAFLILQHVAAVVNTGQTKKIQDSANTSFRSNDGNTSTSAVEDLVSDGSEKAIRREGSTIPHTYESPSLSVPVYGVPNGPSNNVIYPAPPPDSPPPPSKSLPSSVYGTPTFGKTYGVPQINPLPTISKGYGLPPVKYGFPLFSSNQFSTNLIPPKPIYGPPKNTYGHPAKPFKYQKYSSKGFDTRLAKPVHGAPLNFKDTFSYNKFNLKNNNFNTNSVSGLYGNSLSSNNAYPGLYSGISSLNHQYGAPILPPKNTVFSQYGSLNNILSTQYDVPGKTFVEQPVVAYGPPQPSPNPRPPHPGALAPPTPPDIKYDGWQPIPGLVSKRPVEESHHITAQGSGYNDLSLSSHNIGNDQLSNSYGAAPITLDISYGNSLIDQSELGNSYGVPHNFDTGSKTGVSDSYSAPLGTVTGSGGIVASSGAEAHGGSAAVAHSDTHSNAQSLTIDLSSLDIGHGSDVHAIKSVEYEISPHGILDSNTGSSFKISETYEAPQLSSSSLGGSYGSKNSYNSIGSVAQNSKNSFSLHGQKPPPFGPTKGLVPPSGVYGVPANGQFGTSLYSNNYRNSRPGKRPVLHREPIKHGLFQNIAKESYKKDIHSFGDSSSSLYVPPPPAGSSISYGAPGVTGAISFQNVVHGSSTAGIDLHQNSLNIGASSLPLTSYNTALGSADQSYKSSENAFHVALDYSHPSHTIDLAQGKHAQFSHDCGLNNQVPPLSYGIPSADSYTSSMSNVAVNTPTLQGQGLSDLASPQPHGSDIFQDYGLQDLSHSSSIKSESKVNSVEVNEETHGKNYGKSVAESFGPNSELVESQSLDLNNISLQGNLGSYTLQIQSADGSGAQLPHTQVLNDGLLQSILQAIEQPGQQGQNNRYPIILQPSIERDNYSVNQTADDSQSQASEIREVIVDAPKNNENKGELHNQDNEETLQFLDTSNIALYYKKENNMNKVQTDDKEEANKSR